MSTTAVETWAGADLSQIGPIYPMVGTEMILVIVGGLLYTGGAIVYAMKKPNPWPGHFGFHEIFHVCTVLAFLCHWTACLLIALDPLRPSLGAS